MGIIRVTAESMIREAIERPFGGSVLQLGRQGISFTWREFVCWAGDGRFPFSTNSGETRMTDQDFFRAIGFDQVESLDRSSYEGATRIGDLNGRPFMADQFDLVFDGGTMEHIFDVRSALENIFSFTKIGGRVVHLNPVSNYIDHGFYSISPTLYDDYYRANGWRIERHTLFVQSPDMSQFRTLDYQPGSWDHERKVLDSSVVDQFFVATKLAGSTCDKAPIQRKWR